ncbi:conserved hypothetical protein [Lacticaseibacillus casei DSM 20011 = JCM 1134 = ATCC 393]|nr:conserved hypothetical protein [Lacticaseibacillus casei DSM 20011 = JCM 1134 = ATCC 393]
MLALVITLGLVFLNGDLSTPLAGGIIGASIGILILPFISTDRSGLEKLYAMLPIQRHTIVASHYLFGLIVTILIDGIAMLIIGVGTIARFNPVRDAQSFWGILLFGTGLVLFQIMLSFPIMIFLGYQRAPLAAYLPVTLILVIVIFLERSLNLTLTSMRPWLGLMAVVLILLFAFSWWISTVLYDKREF